MGGLGSGGFDGDVGKHTKNLPKTNLLRRFVDEGDMLLRRVLEKEEGRYVYDVVVRESIENDDIWRSYDVCYDRLLDYADKLGLSSDSAKMVAWAMVKKAFDGIIYNKLLGK